jgi:DNA-directed RNA polymerase specialized sigma24 family protein
VTAHVVGREPTGQELYEALVALKAIEAPVSHSVAGVIFEKLFWLHKRRRSFVTGASEEVVVEAWLKAVHGLGKFRGSSAGEAVSWLHRIARSVSIDEHRKQKRERRAFTLVEAPEPPVSPSLDMLPLDDGEAEGEAFLLELRDEHLGAFCAARFPRRRAARQQVELAYLAAMDRDAYAAVLREADDDRERQSLHKKMGRGRDELWLPFLESFEREQALERFQHVLIRGLIEALEATRRADHGRPRGAAGEQP